MRANLKSEKGAITLIVLVSMLFLTVLLMSMYIRYANKAQTSAETTKQIAEEYNNLDEANTIYDSYFEANEVIPIYTKEQLKKIGSGEPITIDGKIYTFSSNAYYTLKSDLDLGGYFDETTKTWTASEEDEWEPLPLTDSQGNQYAFTGILDGLGHTITGLYINNSNGTNQGLFGILEGTVKNLRIEESYINANDSVGGIVGTNNGTVQKCYSEAIILGNSNVGTIVGTNKGTFNVRDVENYVLYNEKLLDETNILKVNTKYVQDANVAVIPKGFNIIEVDGKKSIDDGLVIQDEKGNEFVWIPVEVAGNDTETKISSFYRSEWENNERGTSLVDSTKYTEPYSSNAWEVQEYNSMLESVYNNGGFYIGRYEAGSQVSGVATPRTNTSNETSEVVVKRDQYPYIYVGWGASMTSYTDDVVYADLIQGNGATYLSKNMYTEINNVGVVSTLCYGVQWDAMLDFIKDTTHNVTDSVSWGNYKENSWTIDRIKAKYYEETTGEWISAQGKSKASSTEAFLLTTGASDNFVTKNIYDVAGNVWEWTMETYFSDSVERRVYRGGDYFGIKVYPASFRGNHYEQTWCEQYCSFRPALYIK